MSQTIFITNNITYTLKNLIFKPQKNHLFAHFLYDLLYNKTIKFLRNNDEQRPRKSSARLIGT